MCLEPMKTRRQQYDGRATTPAQLVYTMMTIHKYDGHLIVH